MHEIFGLCLFVSLIIINPILATNLSVPRYYLAATSVGNLALFAGGINGSVAVNTVDIFNYNTKQWSVASLSQPRYYLQASSVLDIAIFVGGSNNSAPSPIVDIFNYTTNTWTYTNLPQTRSEFGVVSVCDTFMFAGGIATGSVITDRVDIYNATSNTWTWSNLSLARWGLAAGSVKDLALFGGGGTGSTVYDTVDIYNCTSKTWDTAILSQARRYLTAVRVGDLVLFAGGSTMSTVSDVVDIFNSTSKTWSSASLSQRRTGLSGASVGNLAMFAGGSGYSDCVDVYNSTSNTWTNSTLSLSRAYLAGVSLFDIVMFAGGTYNDPNAGSKAADRVDTYNSTYNYWSPQTCQSGSFVNPSSPIGICTVCPSGYFSSSTNSPNCTMCDAGYYSAEGSTSCAVCTGGSNSKPGSASCSTDKKDTKTLTIAITTLGVLFGAALLGIVAALVVIFRRKGSQDNMIPLQVVDTGRWTVVQNVQVGERLGGGNFADVFKGTWNGTTSVALKKLKSAEQLSEFAKEAEVLQSLNHPNIVRSLGIHTTSSKEQYIVMEYMASGSVDVLLAVEKKSIQLVDLLSMAKDAAAGMLYLEQQKIVHRDLALRNLLATPNGNGKYTVKVSDFGLSRQIREEGFYTKPETNGIPIRWSAPEVLERGLYSSKSDAWSFGIMLWELFTYGQIPYTGMLNSEVMQRVLAGFRLACPDTCPQEIHELMDRCWHHRPEARPGFKEVYDTIESVWSTTAAAFNKDTKANNNNNNTTTTNSNYFYTTIEQ